MGAVKNGSYAVYDKVIFTKTPTKIRFCHSGEGSPKIALKLGGINGTVLAEMTVVPSKNYTVFKEQIVEVAYTGEAITGSKDVFLCLNSGLNIAWFEFLYD